MGIYYENRIKIYSYNFKIKILLWTKQCQSKWHEWGKAAEKKKESIRCLNNCTKYYYNKNLMTWTVRLITY